MPNITKPMSNRDGPQVLKAAYNEVDSSLTMSGFLTSQIGNKITSTVSTTSIANDTETFNYYENSSTLLYAVKLIYTDGTREQLLSAERIA
jgi:hypothetical protein